MYNAISKSYTHKKFYNQLPIGQFIIQYYELLLRYIECELNFSSAGCDME